MIDLEAIEARVKAASVQFTISCAADSILIEPKTLENADFLTYAAHDVVSLLAEVERLNEQIRIKNKLIHAPVVDIFPNLTPKQKAEDAEIVRLENRLSSVTAERDAAVETMSNLLKHSDDDICAYCKNRVECKEKECDCYEHGKGAVDMDGNEHPDFEWTCKDFNYGTCQKMKGTKCEKCFENGYSGFEWVGIGKEQNNGN